MINRQLITILLASIGLASCTSSVRYQERDGSIMVETGDDTYALSSTLLAQKNWKSVTMNGDDITITTPTCEIIKKSFSSLSPQEKNQLRAAIMNIESEQVIRVNSANEFNGKLSDLYSRMEISYGYEKSSKRYVSLTHKLDGSTMQVTQMKGDEVLGAGNFITKLDIQNSLSSSDIIGPVTLQDGSYLSRCSIDNVGSIMMGKSSYLDRTNIKNVNNIQLGSSSYVSRNEYGSIENIKLGANSRLSRFNVKNARSIDIGEFSSVDRADIGYVQKFQIGTKSTVDRFSANRACEVKLGSNSYLDRINLGTIDKYELGDGQTATRVNTDGGKCNEAIIDNQKFANAIALEKGGFIDRSSFAKVASIDLHQGGFIDRSSVGIDKKLTINGNKFVVTSSNGLISTQDDQNNLSVSVNGPDGLAHVFVNKDVVTFVDESGRVTMKPVSCLSADEKKIVDEVKRSMLT